MPHTDSIASVLGLSKRGRPVSPSDLIAQIEGGLPVAALDRLCAALAPDAPSFKYRIVARATLDRRRKQQGGRLSAEESGRLARVAKVWAFARHVWKSDEEARIFLFGPHMLLRMRPAIDVALGSDVGAERVMSILGGLLYGTAV